MDKSHKHDVEQKDQTEDTVCFYFYSRIDTEIHHSDILKEGYAVFTAEKAVSRLLLAVKFFRKDFSGRELHHS